MPALFILIIVFAILLWFFLAKFFRTIGKMLWSCWHQVEEEISDEQLNMESQTKKFNEFEKEKKDV